MPHHYRHTGPASKASPTGETASRVLERDDNFVSQRRSGIELASLKRNVFVTGGCGYVGSLLVPQLLGEGYTVTVLDTQWFGNGNLPKTNGHLTTVKGDIRDIRLLAKLLKGQDAVIHLACISNDTCCQLDECLSTSINYEAFEPLVVLSKAAGISRFIYCSSSSVYGLSTAKDVTEDHPLVPLTLYNKYKGLCEPLLLKHIDERFTGTIIRPATVCGVAPRQRFDLTVNAMTNHAVQKGEITVYGGTQMRPNLHIQDMCDAYKLLLKAPVSLIQGQVFNIGRENMTVYAIAELIAKTVGDYFKKAISITTVAATDNRSYHINSDKIKHVLGFEPKLTVQRAIHDMCVMFAQGAWKDSLTNPIYTNVLQLMNHGFATKDQNYH